MTTIAVDIGHGSNTFPPSKGVYKNGKAYHEHSFNAKLGVAIKKLLERNGFKVIMGQQPNKHDVPLIQRTNLYNSKKVDLVVSLHANAGTSSVSGRCAFYWHTSSKSKKMATLVVDEIKKTGYSTHGDGLHASERGSWTNLHICRETNMPAVLIEHGFMTNDHDFKLIFGSDQKQYIQDMANADVKAICRYFGVKFKGDKPNKNKGGLSVSEKKELEKLRKEVASLKKLINKKEDKPSKTNNPSSTHKKGHDFVTNKNISDGSKPLTYATREQVFTIIKNYDDLRFNDNQDPSESHKNAWGWLVDVGVTSNGIDPRKPLTREQFATLLLKYNDLVNTEDK